MNKSKHLNNSPGLQLRKQAICETKTGEAMVYRRRIRDQISGNEKMYDDDDETCPGHLVARHMARDNGWVLITDGTANSAVSVVGGAVWTRDELELDDPTGLRCAPWSYRSSRVL
ncbi:hypothetical protein Q7P35_008286 [Cladosporium inversicolor]